MLVAVTAITAMAFSLPLVVVFFGATSETFFMCFNTMESALLGYAQHPLLGVGLNNGTASMKASPQETAAGNLSPTVGVPLVRGLPSRKACRRLQGVVVADVAEKRRTPLSREDSARVGTDKVMRCGPKSRLFPMSTTPPGCGH